MRDLDIWQRLHNGAATPADLAAVASMPLSRRCAYVGPAHVLVTHDDAEVRAAAVRVLGGVRAADGVRAIVSRLNDSSELVRVAALDALREIARDAPARYAHAVFHTRDDVRQAALAADLPTALGELAIYLRADPACADRAREKARWPAESLPLAFAMYADGHVDAHELVEHVTNQTPTQLRTFLLHARRRSPEDLAASIDQASSAQALPRPRGTDILDLLASALANVPSPARALDHLVETASSSKQKSLVQRVAVALLTQLARDRGQPVLWTACAALEPRVIGFASFPIEHGAAVGDGLYRHRWPVRATKAVVERLLRTPHVRGNLALAAAVAGLGPAKRLRLLVEAIGEDAIIASLVASDHGWDEICRLPPEGPALELAWLARVESLDYKRYVALAGIVIGSFSGARLGMFVEQMPRRHRPPVFLAALLAHATASEDRLLAVCKIIAARVDRHAAIMLLPALLDRDPSGRLAVGLARYVPDKLLAAAATELSVADAVRFAAVLDEDPVPRDRELAIAGAFAERGIAEIRDWCDRVLAIASEPLLLATPPVVRVRRELTTIERNRISTCADRVLEVELAPALGGSVSGLCQALDRRTAHPHVWACAALLACADPLEDVARVLDRFAVATDAFDRSLDDAVARMTRVAELPPLARARLWRWEAHQFQLVDWIDATGGVMAALQLVESLRGSLARKTLWQGISEALMLLRYRAMPRFRAHASIELALFAASLIDTEVGRHAARIVVALVESGCVPVAAVRDRVLDRIADADAETRAYAARLVRLEGVPQVQEAAGPPAANILEQIRRTTELDALAMWCLDIHAPVVQEAALALVALGDAGQLRLAELLIDRLPAAPQPILATIVLWDHEPAIERVRVLVVAPDLEPAWRFYISLALLQRGEPRLASALDAVRAHSERWYFRRADWEALIRAGDLVTSAIAVTDSSHHHAYQPAIQILLSLTRPVPEVRDALARFLRVDANRPIQMRFAVARYLARHWGDLTGMPLLIEQICDATNGEVHTSLPDLPADSYASIIGAVADAALLGGDPVCSEKRLWWLLGVMRNTHLLPRELVAGLDVRILEGASTAQIRRNAATMALEESSRSGRVQRVAEVFAWGVKRGVELTGRLLKIHLTSKETELGHTRLDTSRIFVSPLPMLRAEAHGQDIVEGLVLHEIGHHVYHRSEEAQALWKQAHAEGIGHFLNLIADEHLERNLRAVDASYGDRLKRLGAYAFQHAPQEIKLAALCDSLGASTARALIAAELDVAFDEASVRMRRGAILVELDRSGHPLARFARALRMGLGNRSNDPLIAQALALCGRDLRTLDMRGLYDLTKQLVELFGGRVELARVFGGPEGLAFGERDDDVFGGGLDDDILQREIERILEPRRSRPGAKNGRPDRLAINVNPDTEFDRISKIVRVQGDRDAHRAVATQIKRHSMRLAGYLDELGLKWEPVRARTQGRALDRTRLRALVTRNDPRILMARTPVRRTDLFLGTIVDCSGSMSARDNIDRARRFAILVAEAVRPLPGVEARFFGFTDSVIYDAGDKNDCNVVALQANGGNNDAAALHHAANVALAAPQRAKVLVMISDGLPTECSTAAVKNLVTHLTRRRGIVCAQVAVIPLNEVCFPHYILINDDQLDTAVAKFGRMIADLARRSLAS